MALLLSSKIPYSMDIMLTLSLSPSGKWSDSSEPDQTELSLFQHWGWRPGNTGQWSGILCFVN